MQTLVDGITYNNASNNPTTGGRVVTLTSLTDNGGTASGGVDSTALSSASTVSVVAVNDAPTVSAPASISVTEDVVTALTGISFADADAGDATVTATLAVGSGTLKASSGSGVVVSGSETATLTMSGSIANVNSFIAASNVTFITDLNATSNVTLTVTIDDGGNTGTDPGTSGTGSTEAASTTVTLAVTAVNDAPTNVVLSDSTVPENASIGTTVGTFSTTDPEGGPFTYDFVTGYDEAAFTIDGNTLKTATTLSFAAKSSYTVVVRSADPSLAYFDKTFTITVTEVNVAPTDIALTSTSIAENTASGSTVGTLSATDANTTDTFTYSLASGADDDDNGSFTIAGNELKLNVSPDFETKSSYKVRVKVTDLGGLTSEKAFVITITNVNEKPVLTTSGGTTSFTETAGGTSTPVAIDSGLTVADADSANLTGAVISITGNFNSAQDVLAFTNQLGITGSYNSATGVLTLSGSATVADYETALKSVTYTNSSHNPTTGTRTITFTVNDGEFDSTAATKLVSITPTNDAPTISTQAAISVTEGSTAAFTAEGTDPDGSITWSITGGADAAKFSIVPSTGVVTFASAPSFSTPTDSDAKNDYVLEITAYDGTIHVAKTVTVTITKKAGGGGSTSTSTPSTTSTVVEVNGQKQDAGTAATTTTGGQTVTTIKVDETKLNNLLETSGNNSTVTLPTSTTSDVVVGELTGQTIKNMETKEATLEIKTETVTYTLPASQINIDAVSSQIGTQVELKDIKVSVSIAEPSADTVKIVEDTANKNSYQLVVKPVEFEITCTSGNKTIEVSKFNGYVERTVAIPDGIDPSKITTGIVLNNDGTFRHVPTALVVVNGKYFAKINSLTNSTYSVIYNPVEFTDVASHWAKTAINDMGSRMVVTGDGAGNYNPDNNITRAEFATISVRAMGLTKGSTESSFGDVTLTDWFNGYVDTATSYGLITGYDTSSFGPNDTITREQAMAIIARALKTAGLSVSLTDSEVNELLSKYTDGNAVSDYAKQSIAACLKAGIVTGSSATTISPKDYVTRAEVAVMIQRMLQKSKLI